MLSRLGSSFRPSLSITRSKHYDVAIVGGGIMGMSSAFFISKRLPPSSICVIERDSTYSLASTPKSVGSMRQQFSLSENIQLSSFSYNFLQNVDSHLRVSDPVDIGFVRGGYLFLATEKGRQVLLENHKVQREHGAEVELIEASQMELRFPWINPAGLSIGSLGVGKEGWFDPWLLLSAFRNKIVHSGIEVINSEVIKVDCGGGLIQGATLRDSNGNSSQISCSHLINAAGPWSDSVMKLLSPDLGVPIRPRKRMVFVFKCKSFSDSYFPMLIDTSGVYSRREGSLNTFICGKSPSPSQDPDTFDTEVDYNFFDQEIWPHLAFRVPGFESLKVASGWAGSYEYNTLDQNGIIGRHGLVGNLIVVGGFSGHGIQQSPAVGRAVSELLLDGVTHSIQLERMGLERVEQNRPLKEKSII